MTFNLANAKAWKPFFSKSFPNPGLASIQVDLLEYMAVDNQYALNLQDKWVSDFILFVLLTSFLVKNIVGQMDTINRVSAK